MKPIRITLSRKRGWRLQEFSKAANGLAAVKVCRPGKWGNPFIVAETFTNADAVKAYQSWIGSADWHAWMWENHRSVLLKPEVQAVGANNHFRFLLDAELKGKNLACFCKQGEPCHANTLLTLSNYEN